MLQNATVKYCLKIKRYTLFNAYGDNIAYHLLNNNYGGKTSHSLAVQFSKTFYFESLEVR